jgi:hypothetical protein
MPAKIGVAKLVPQAIVSELVALSRKPALQLAAGPELPALVSLVQ